MKEGDRKHGKKELLTQLREPVQCHLWRKESIAPGDLDFKTIETYYDSSHLTRSLLQCNQCGQLYYHEFYEIVDWEGGNDQMFDTYIPVDSDKAALEKLNNKSFFELLGVFPRLQHDKDIRWIVEKKEGHHEV